MNILSFKELDSTNKYVKENIELISDRTIVYTDVQSDGYGRFSREWVDLGVDNVYMSFVLKPAATLLEVHAGLTQYLSVCLCKQLEGMALNPFIKWPNDVLIKGKKVGGILAESVIKGGVLKGIALGIGVNLNSAQETIEAIDRPATSLNLELGHAINKQEFMQNLINDFFEHYDEFLTKGFGYIKTDYEKFSIYKESGQDVNKISVAIFNSVKTGEFKGFDCNGNLLLSMSDGNIEKLNMGEII